MSVEGSAVLWNVMMFKDMETNNHYLPLELEGGIISVETVGNSKSEPV